MDELDKKFMRWYEFDSTHRTRQMNIFKRHQENITQWVDVIRNNPVFPAEQMETVLSLHRELSNIFEEMKENYLDLGNDAGDFSDILGMLIEKIKSLPDA